MKKISKRTLTPKLRFPEFKEQWDEGQLSQLAHSISDRVGTMTCIPYTVTSGLGLVSQEEKFGRTIAGNSLRNYIRLQKDDFAYNKSATKAYPEGYISRYLDEARAAVPNSIFTCFRVDSEKVDPAYLDFLFAGNLHGRWLRKFLTIGARAHGSLNVSDDDLMALPVPLPSPPEQQKIAECLSSLDGLIAAEGRMLEVLKAHKKGLMQQLFPQPGQTQPRLRLPAFKGDWIQKKGGEITIKITKGSSPSWQGFSYQSEGVLFITSENVRDGFLYVSCPKYLPKEFYEKQKYSQLSYGDILINIVGASIGRNCLYLSESKAFTNQAVALFRVDNKNSFVFINYCYQHDVIQKAVFGRQSDSARPNLSLTDLREMVFILPSLKEQQKIADCLTSLDTRITAQATKIETLKQHKRGLMQQLFPAPEEQ